MQCIYSHLMEGGCLLACQTITTHAPTLPEAFKKPFFKELVNVFRMLLMMFATNTVFKYWHGWVFLLNLASLWLLVLSHSSSARRCKSSEVKLPKHVGVCCRSLGFTVCLLLQNHFITFGYLQVSYIIKYTLRWKWILILKFSSIYLFLSPKTCFQNEFLWVFHTVENKTFLQGQIKSQVEWKLMRKMLLFLIIFVDEWRPKILPQ